uniref:Uncharacterized protein n=1 Tax=Mycena chlorophos TaxID=658473 RepID=A0ABQ0M517_MYCCL|nr:predicted protein [Mycena chlorophos]
MSGTKLSFRELVSLGLKPGDAWGEEKHALEKELDRHDRAVSSYSGWNASYAGPPSGPSWDGWQAPVASQHSRASSSGPLHNFAKPSNLAERTSAAPKSTGRSYTGTYPEPPATRTSYHGPGPTQTSRSSSSQGSTSYHSNGTISGRTFATIDSSHRSYNSQPPLTVPVGYYSEPAAASAHPQYQHSRSSLNQDYAYPVAAHNSKSRSADYHSPSTYHQPLPRAQDAYGDHRRAGSPSGSVASAASTSSSQGYVRHAPSAYAYTQDHHRYANPQTNAESFTSSRLGPVLADALDRAYYGPRPSRFPTSPLSARNTGSSYAESPSSSYWRSSTGTRASTNSANRQTNTASLTSSRLGLGVADALQRACSGYVHVEYLDEKDEDEDGHDDGGEWGDSIHDEEFDEEDDGYDDDTGGDFDDDDDDDYYDDDGTHSTKYSA